jgi:hypothetical protein
MAAIRHEVAGDCDPGNTHPFVAPTHQRNYLNCGASPVCPMSEEADHLAENKRLLRASAQIRLEAIRSEVALLTTLCQTVDIEVADGRRGEARRIIAEARRILNHLRGSVTRFAKEDTPAVRHQLSRLEIRIRRIEDRSQ